MVQSFMIGTENEDFVKNKNDRAFGWKVIFFSLIHHDKTSFRGDKTSQAKEILTEYFKFSFGSFL